MSSMAHSWKGRLYSVNRFQSAYARRTMILPFSSRRSRTSLSSNCLYCASFTPRAMFSKSMNIASFRSPFISAVLSNVDYTARLHPPESFCGRCIVTEMTTPKADPALAARVPPGQVLTTKWPVLTYGRTPRFDPRTWSFRCFGLVEEETSWSWEEFQALPRAEIACDIHCVTRWSRLDNRFEGVPVREIVRRVRPKPEARYDMMHGDP